MRPIATARNESGFTLVEVMVTVALLMILILGIGAMVTVSFRADTYNQERHIADKLAQMVLERTLGFAVMGHTNYENLVENDKPGAIGAQGTIPGVRPHIPPQLPGDRILADFDGDGVDDYGFGSKRIYVYQLLVKNVEVGGHIPASEIARLKLLTLRIYYADQTSADPAVDLRRHPNPGGQRPHRFEHPLTEVCTYVALPADDDPS